MRPLFALVARAWAVSGALSLAACAAAAPPAGTDPLSRTEWRLQDLNGQGVIAGSTVTAVFGPDGRASGQAGCNRWFGSWTREADGLSLTQLGSTRMACAPDLMDQEARYLSALQETDARRLEADGRLVLTTRDGRSLTFAPATP